MHISMGKLPSQDAEDKARLVKVRKGSTVLDVCCGGFGGGDGKGGGKEAREGW